MAGEWIAYDLALPAKPEVQELIDTTGEPVEVVVYRLLQLWGWASMHCADGTARMTLPRLVRTCGGDDAFWQAVAAVGWLEIDETAATVAVPGWDRRFSQAAKSRLQHRDRAAAQNEREPDRRQRRPVACAQAQAPPAPGRSRGEEIRGESPPPPREASQFGEAWQRLRAAWNAGDGKATRRRPWKPATPPDGIEAATGSPEALEAALAAVERLPRCLYFTTPVPMTQFLLPGFISRTNGGHYDDPKTPKGGDRRDGDRPAPRVDPAFEAARKATEAREAARREAEHRRLDEAAVGDDFESARATVLAKLREAAT